GNTVTGNHEGLAFVKLPHDLAALVAEFSLGDLPTHSATVARRATGTQRPFAADICALLLHPWVGLASARQAKGGFKRGKPDAAGSSVGPSIWRHQLLSASSGRLQKRPPPRRPRLDRSWGCDPVRFAGLQQPQR